MPTLQERIEAATGKIETDSALMHQIVHGGAATVVETEGGNVPAIAKQVADLNAAYASAGAVEACEAERLGAEAARDVATAKATEATVSAADAAAIKADVLAALAAAPREDSTTIASAHTVTAAEKGWQFTVNAGDGAVPITAPNSADVSPAIDEPWPFWVVKSKEDTSSNAVTILPQGTDTINGGASYEITKAGAGVRLTLDEDVTPHNWTVVEFGAVTGDAEPIGFLKSFAKGALPYGYLPRDGSGFLVEAYLGLAALMYVGDASNATASAWYRFTDIGNPTGTRSTTGAYMLTDVAEATVLKEVDLGVRAATSGTSLDWDVPTGAERVVVSLYDVSTSGTSSPVIRIGQGAPDTAGYASYVSQLGSAVETGSLTSGFRLINTSAASIAFLGRVEISRDADGGFACSSHLGYSSPGTLNMVGRKSIASFDKLRLTTINGTDKFDAGTARAVAYVPTQDGVPCIKAFGVAATPAEADIAALITETQAQNAKIAAMGTPNGCAVYQTTGTPLTVSTWVTLGFDTEEYDDGGWHDPAANNSRITVDFTGRLEVIGTVDFGRIAGQALFGLRLLKNGTVIRVADSTTGAASGITGVNLARQVIDTVAVVPGDYIELQAYTNSASQTSGVGAAGSTLKARRLAGSLGDAAPVMATDTVIAQGLVDIPHALGKVPTSIDFAYHCINASQGFGVGEYAPAVPWPSGISETASGTPWLTGNGFQVVAVTDTLIRVKFANGYSSTKTISLLHKDTGARADVFNTDWRITARVS